MDLDLTTDSCSIWKGLLLEHLFIYIIIEKLFRYSRNQDDFISLKTCIIISEKSIHILLYVCDFFVDQIYKLIIEISINTITLENEESGTHRVVQLSICT
jgi:hypothetical protein